MREQRKAGTEQLLSVIGAVMAAGFAVGGCNRVTPSSPAADTSSRGDTTTAVPANVQQHIDAAKVSDAKEAEAAAIRRRQTQK